MVGFHAIRLTGNLRIPLSTGWSTSLLCKGWSSSLDPRETNGQRDVGIVETSNWNTETQIEETKRKKKLSLKRIIKFTYMLHYIISFWIFLDESSKLLHELDALTSFWVGKVVLLGRRVRFITLAHGSWWILKKNPTATDKLYYVKKTCKILVGGWTNPSEKYARQIGSFPQVSG